MEVYFKNLTEEEGTTGRLLHDLNVLEENTEELFLASQGKVAGHSKEKFIRGLERVKATCQNLQERARSNDLPDRGTAGGFPYPTMGIVFSLGILMGILFGGGSDPDA